MSLLLLIRRDRHVVNVGSGVKCASSPVTAPAYSAFADQKLSGHLYQAGTDRHARQRSRGIEELETYHPYC